MDQKRKDAVRAAFEAATKYAIEQMGVDRFRETSFFGERYSADEKLAA